MDPLSRVRVMYHEPSGIRIRIQGDLQTVRETLAKLAAKLKQ